MEHQPEGGDTAEAKPAASPDAVAELGEHHSGQVRIAYRLERAYVDKLLHVNGIGWHYWNGNAARSMIAAQRSAPYSTY